MGPRHSSYYGPYIALFICTGSEPRYYEASNEALKLGAEGIENHAETKVPSISIKHEQTESAFETRK